MVFGEDGAEQIAQGLIFPSRARGRRHHRASVVGYGARFEVSVLLTLSLPLESVVLEKVERRLEEAEESYVGRA
ncbi:hypothetical protein Bca52824_021529 [Brassica carinata]|uniref:Uncharacterized protein n=1 Tax=Brassica carinata TaxID=52824 RepID=A0A8X8ATA8_BRACI|nr:hypothetical protein Bca52824_021529 [Brassica carinata]